MLWDAGADGPASVGSRVSSHGPGKAGAKLWGIHMSPKKINLFATLIRRMHVDDALAQCRLHPKKAGKIIAGVGPTLSLSNGKNFLAIPATVLSLFVSASPIIVATKFVPNVDASGAGHTFCKSERREQTRHGWLQACHR